MAESDLPEINDDNENTGGRYLGALVLVAGITPLFFLATLLTLIIYFSKLPQQPPPIQWLGQGDIVIILGLISTIILWLLLALPCRRFASAKGGRPSDYDLLKTGYTALKNRRQHVADTTTEQDVEHKRARDIAYTDITSELRDFANTLNRNGLNWVSYTGYVSMWDRLNKAGEAMIDLLPPETAIEVAMYDKLRLDGSKVPKNDDLIKALDVDIATLKPNEEPKKETKEEAISDIRTTRSAINKYNNERWGQLVRARNRLLGTAFLAAFFIYILLAIALLVPFAPSVLPSNIIEKAIVFYFVGAIVGLFYRLYSEWSANDTVTEEADYGLTMARVFVTPLLSGLAALVGILLLTSAMGKIEEIYAFSLQNLVVAAVLGYAPNTVIDKLSAKQKDIQGQINSTSVADHADQGGASKGAGKGGQ